MSEGDKGAEGVEWEDEAEDEMEIEWAERDKGEEGVEWVKGDGVSEFDAWDAMAEREEMGKEEWAPLSPIAPFSLTAPITPFIPINSGYIPFQTSMQSSSNSAFAPMENPKNS